MPFLWAYPIHWYLQRLCFCEQPSAQRHGDGDDDDDCDCDDFWQALLRRPLALATVGGMSAYTIPRPRATQRQAIHVAMSLQLSGARPLKLWERLRKQGLGFHAPPLSEGSC